MTESKKNRLREIQEQRLKMFEGDFYQEKKVGDSWYVKSWNGGTKKWQVSVFSEASHRRYKSFKGNFDKNTELFEEEKFGVPFKRPTLESIRLITEK